MPTYSLICIHVPSMATHPPMKNLLSPDTSLVFEPITSLVHAERPSPLYEARKQLFTSLVSPGLAVRASYWSTSLVYKPWLVTSLVTRLVCSPVRERAKHERERAISMRRRAKHERKLSTRES